MRRGLQSLLLVLVALALPAPAAALTLEPIAPPGSFSDPIYVTSDRSDPDRLLVVERSGRVVLSNAGTQSTFLDLGAAGLVAGGGERGAFSVALAPDYATSGRLYVFYTAAATSADPGLEGDLQLDELTATGDSASIATRRPVLTIEHSAEGNHNGGQIQFGPDGYLYLATGDGGGGGDPEEDAQDLGSPLGKLLRIDPRQAGGNPYSVPADNPFVGVAGADPRVWSYGLRNPWRFSFDRLNGDLLIGDVGQGSWEEVDYHPAPDAGRAVNFGWDCREGAHNTPESGDPHCVPPFADPIFEYMNPSSGPAAITGGYVVRDPALDDLQGRYLYADFFAGEIRSLVPGLPSAGGDRGEGVTVGQLVSFGEDSCGRIYVASFEDDTVYRLAGSEATVCDAPAPPVAPVPPTPTASCRGKTATIVASGGKLAGTGGRDVIVGSPGRDRIRGAGGRDLICAGAGADRLSGGPGRDRLRGGPAADRLSGGPGRDRCTGGPGSDRKRSC